MDSTHTLAEINAATKGKLRNELAAERCDIETYANELKYQAAVLHFSVGRSSHPATSAARFAKGRESEFLTAIGSGAATMQDAERLRSLADSAFGASAPPHRFKAFCPDGKMKDIPKLKKGCGSSCIQNLTSWVLRAVVAWETLDTENASKRAAAPKVAPVEPVTTPEPEPENDGTLLV